MNRYILAIDEEEMDIIKSGLDEVVVKCQRMAIVYDEGGLVSKRNEISERLCMVTNLYKKLEAISDGRDA